MLERSTRVAALAAAFALASPARAETAEAALGVQAVVTAACSAGLRMEEARVSGVRAMRRDLRRLARTRCSDGSVPRIEIVAGRRSDEAHFVTFVY